MYLYQLHNQAELRGRVHLLNQHDDVGVLHPPQNSYFILDEMLLRMHTHIQRFTSESALLSLVALE